MKQNLVDRCVYDLVENDTNDDDLHLFFNFMYNVRFTCVE